MEEARGFIVKADYASLPRMIIENIISVTDENGNVVARYNYGPWGETDIVHDDDGSGAANPIRYTEREMDETGLYYYRARYYSPRMGRFISEDPIGYGGGDVNWYAYVGNSPLNRIDPLGLWKIRGGGSFGGFDIFATLYDSDYGWLPWYADKPEIGVSTTLIGWGAEFSWGESDERCKLYPGGDEEFVSIGPYGKYISYGQSIDMPHKYFILGLGIGTPISFSTSIQNFGDWLQHTFQKYSKYK